MASELYAKTIAKTIPARTPTIMRLWIFSTAALVLLGIVVLLQATGAAALAAGWWALLLVIPAVLAAGKLEYAAVRPAFAVQPRGARER